MQLFDITPSNKDQYDKDFLNNNDGICIVKVHSPGCGHCTAMASAWKELENNSSQLGGGISKLGSIDISTLSEFNPKFQSGGVPQILALDNQGNVIKEHQGERTLNGLQEFIKGLTNQNGGKRKRKTKKYKRKKYKSLKKKGKKSKKKKRTRKR
jgi:thioredoxin-like negative regulator of GroEL